LERIQSCFRQGVQWDEFWKLAREHGVGYFVGNHILAHLPSNNSTISNGKPVPASSPEFIGQIKQDVWQETAHALVLRDQQLRLNAELERCGIPAIWLKGLVLAERLYGRFEARHCGDLDLLPQPSDIQKSEELLTRLRFERFRPAEAGIEFHPMAAHHSRWCARVLPDWMLVVELHHRLSGPSSCQPAPADMLQRSQLVEFQGQQMRVPSVEDELLSLCLHAHHHNYALLRCLMDLAEFVRRFQDEINWKKLVHQARENRCLGRIRAALEITDLVLGLENSSEVLREISSLTTRQRWGINALSISRLLDPRNQQSDRLQAQFALLMDSWTDTIRSLSPRLFPSGDHVNSICPTSWHRAPGGPRLYYYLHSARVFLK
jgi:hypothetical protein